MPVSTKVIAVVIAVVVIGAAASYSYYMSIQPKPPGTAEITLYTKAGMWIDFVREHEIIEDYKERMLGEKNIDVTVLVTTAPHRGYEDKLVTDFAAGTEGDVIWCSPALTADLAGTEYLLDLTPYVNEWDEWDQFYQAGKDMYTWEDKVWGIPNDASTMVLYYRKDLFQQAGLPDPWQPETWDDVIEVGLILKEEFPDLPMIIEPWYEPQLPAYSDGGVMLDPEDGKWIAKSPQLLYMFQLYYDIFFTHELTPKEFKLENWDDRMMFSVGEMALMIDGTWCYTEKWGPGGPAPIEDRANIIGYAHPPSSGRPDNPHGKYPNTFRDCDWIISARTENPELAFELVKELTKADIIATWGYETSHLIGREDALVGDYAADEFLAWNTGCLQYAVPKPCSPLLSRYWDTLNAVLTNDLLVDEKTPEECLEIFAQRVTEELGEENVKELP